MRLPDLQIERKFIDSRVARRLFWIVATSAVLPVATFATFSYVQVKAQLEADASNTLRSAVKESGMAILDRLEVADESLRLRILSSPVEARSPSSRPTSRAIRSIARLESDDPRLATIEAELGAPITSEQGSLISERTSQGPRLLLLRRREQGEPDAPIWIAELDSDFIFRADSQHPNDRFWVRDASGRLLFWSPSDWMPAETEPGIAHSRHRRDIDEQPSLVETQRIVPLGRRTGNAWTLSQSRPLVDIHRPLLEFQEVFPWVVGITLGIAVFLVLSQIRRTLTPIDALTATAERIAAGDFDARVEVRTGDEFESLAESFNHMTRVIGDHIHVLGTINSIGAALSAESDTNRVLELILRGVVELTNGSHGVLFLLDDDKNPTPAMAVDSDGRKSEADEDATVEAAPLQLVSRCLESGMILHGAGPPGTNARSDGGWQGFEERLGGSITDYLALPMRVENGRPIGVLLVVRTREGIFSDEDAILARSLASQAAVSIRKNEMIENFRGLFEGVVQLTVSAIDEKSPYTGDHCRKVPILVESIADAACEDRDGPLKDFDLDEDARYELRIAALLHDCGKVVTPVHVMDKARKLETITDRIEVIEARFETLRAETRSRLLAQEIAGNEGPSSDIDREGFQREMDRIDEDLGFIRRCNVGQETMSDADCERIREIAARRKWVDASGRVHRILEDRDVMNLTVRRGTLNDEEREIIKQHVVLTINMLEALPWPDEIRQVPAIAGAHHEHIDGSGYPLGLGEAQLSIQARILGLADIFEALTAKTRPYKPGRTLAETIGIMDRMRDEGHIDAGLYELFPREKLHLRYAIEHLGPEQIDPEFQTEIERLTALDGVPGIENPIADRELPR